MTHHSLNVCKAANVEEYRKQLEASETEENYERFLHAAIHSEEAAHIHEAIKMIKVKIGSNAGNKSKLYHQLGIGLCRIGDVKGAKKALEDCLQINPSLWEAENLLEYVDLALDAEKAQETRSGSTLLKCVVLACGIAVGATCSMAISSEKFNEIVGGVKTAGEVGESIEKLAVTNSNDSLIVADGSKVGLGIASIVAGIVGAGFLVGLKKSSSE